MANPPNDEAIPYTPAPHLWSGSTLSAPQLISQFRDFYTNLTYVSCAPVFVFERLVANLNEVFTNALEQERLKHTAILERERFEHAAAIEKCREEIMNLRLSNDKLEMELAGLKVTDSAPEPEVISNSVVGTFYTHDVRRPKDAKLCDRASKLVSFTRPYSTLPTISIGLNALDIPKKSTVRVNAYASDLNNDYFKINIDTWCDSLLRDSGCAWLATNDPDFQTGIYNTGDDHPHTEKIALNIRQITFAKPFSTPPEVLVWLSVLDMSSYFDWRVKTYVTNITTTGFTLHIDTWDDSWLFYICASWLAYPADKPNVYSGTFSTLDIRPANSPQLFNSAYTTFGKDIFSSPPRIFLVFSSLNISCESSLRLTVKASNISALGMMWHLDSWGDSTLYSAGASYIALA